MIQENITERERYRLVIDIANGLMISSVIGDDTLEPIM